MRSQQLFPLVAAGIREICSPTLFRSIPEIIEIFNAFPTTLKKLRCLSREPKIYRLQPLLMFVIESIENYAHFPQPFPHIVPTLSCKD